MYEDLRLADVNVLGGTLEPCSRSPMTGFFRNGCCSTGPLDQGMHVVCVQVTQEFLAYSLSAGNDLSTPHPEWEFPGLKEGDRWCLCALRWREALHAGVAPKVYLQSTHQAVLRVVSLSDLQKYALDWVDN